MTAKALVYIVEDDGAVRDSLKILLESHGLDVEDFETTADFARRYRRSAGQFGDRACLVLDHDLPTTTGLDFLLSPDTVADDLPVILVTGRGDGNMAARSRAAGAVAYFEKPVGDAKLVDEILRLLDLQDAASAD